MSGPLDGITVIDLSRALAGPHAGMMLGDLGARVIKVETPGTGDDTRGWGPPFVGPEDDPVSTYFLSCNRNKESIALDLKSDDGRSVLTRMVRPRRRPAGELPPRRAGPARVLGAERLHELNPRLVVLSISGFGHDGPEGGRAGYDQIAQGEAGLMSLTGPDPDHPHAGRRARSATCSPACTARTASSPRCTSATRTGRGPGRPHLAAGRHRRRARLPGHPLHRRRRGAARPGQPPPLDRPVRPVPLPGRDACRSRWAARALWQQFARRVRPRPRRAGDGHQRRAGRQPRRRSIAAVEAAFADRTLAELLPGWPGPASPRARSAPSTRSTSWDQTRSQGLVIDVDHPVLGRIELPGPPLRFDDNAHAGGTHRAPAPAGARCSTTRRSAPGSTRWTPPPAWTTA